MPKKPCIFAGEKMVNFSLRLPAELRSDIDVAALYLKASDANELVRGWIRDRMRELERESRFLKFRDIEKQKLFGAAFKGQQPLESVAES